MIVRKSSSFLNQEIVIASHFDWSGTAEITVEVFFESDLEQTYNWGVTKTFGGIELEFVSSTCSKENADEPFSLSTAVYRGRAFLRNKVAYEASLTVEPIQSHPLFDTLAGTEDTPNLTEARWVMEDNRNVFIGFREDSEFAGIDSYYAASWTATVEWLQLNYNTDFFPGQVYTTIEDGYLLDGQFLCTGLSQEPFGKAKRITAHLLRAPTWDSRIYTAR